MESIALEELAQLMGTRAHMYNMLSRAFVAEADDDFIRQLRSMHFPQGTGSTATDSAYRQLYAYLRRPAESIIDDLAVDYARTFLGVGTMESRAAFPFESVYTSEKGLLMQEARDEVLAIYRAEGLEGALSNPYNEGEDHLALELLFLCALAQRTQEALEAGDEELAETCLLTQRNFLHDHLMNWALEWATDVPRYAQLPFYPAFAQLLEAFLLEDAALLRELVGAEEDDAAGSGEAEGAIRENQQVKEA